MGALSPAARGDGEFKIPAAWLRPRERPHQPVFLMSSLSPLSKDVHSMRRVLLSVFTQSLAYVASDLSVPQEGGNRRPPMPALAALSAGMWQPHQPPSIPPALHFHPEATEFSQETLEGGLENKGSLQGFL